MSGLNKTDRELLQQALLWLDDGGTYTDKFQNFIDAIRTRLAQPEKEWVGLTMEERDEINDKVYGWVPHYVAFHHAIEQALKEKNAA
jgi:hypothetical protein